MFFCFSFILLIFYFTSSNFDIFQDREVKFLLWDTAGQEEYDELTREYYKGSVACILAFSTIDKDSYNAVQKWHKKVVEQCGMIPTILVQTKLDLEGTQQKVLESEAKELADILNVTLFRVSSKMDLRIKDLFEYLAQAYNNFKNMKNIVAQKEIKEIGTQEVQITKETKEIMLGEIKKNNKKIANEKLKKGDQVLENEKQNEIIRKNLQDKKKKDKCIIF